jgi:hypothetical protein
MGTDLRHLRVAIALAIAAHAALLALPGRRVHPSIGGPDGSPLFTDLHVRLMAAAPSAEAVLESPSAALPGDVRVAPSASVPAAKAEPLPSSPAPWSPVSQDDSRPTEDTGPAEYLTRDLLSVPPRPQTDLLVPFPDQVAGLVDLKVKVGLFIDDRGKVRRVRLDTANVPPVFAHAIETTFLAARFSPGQRDETAVPSFIRVEVEFGARSPR